MARHFDPTCPELMDRPQPVTDELRRDLANLASLNRHFGAYRIVRHFLQPYLKAGKELRVIDFCTASGDIPRVVTDLARKSGCTVKIDAVDFQSASVEIAQELSVSYPEITYHNADALTWNPPTMPDLVLCSLALHHFSESDAVTLLARCRNLPRSATLVADLRRSWLTTAGVYAATTLLYRAPMTVADARESARRAFSYSEMSALAIRAGWKDHTHRRRPFGRQELVYKAPEL